METYLGDCRRFEFIKGTSSKFWEVYEDKEGSVHIRFGRIGSFGRIENYGDMMDVDKKVKGKLAKGYKEVDASRSEMVGCFSELEEHTDLYKLEGFLNKCLELKINEKDLEALIQLLADEGTSFEVPNTIVSKYCKDAKEEKIFLTAMDMLREINYIPPSPDYFADFYASTIKKGATGFIAWDFQNGYGNIIAIRVPQKK